MNLWKFEVLKSEKTDFGDYITEISCKKEDKIEKFCWFNTRKDKKGEEGVIDMDNYRRQKGTNFIYVNFDKEYPEYPNFEPWGF